MRAEPRERSFGAERLQRVLRELRVLAVIVRQLRVQIRQIAASVAGGEQLASHARLPLQQQHAVKPVFGSGERGHHAAGARADDDNG